MSSSFNSCILCSSNNLINLNKYKHAYLTKCKECKFVFSKIRPSEDELIKHYTNYPSNEVISYITVRRYNELLDQFEEFRKSNNIIDVGCGDGFFLDEAKKRGWNVYGTEYRLESVNKCLEKGINIKLGKLTSLHYPIDFFDIITSFEVIEHINNPSEEIIEFKKILRPGGIVYITTPNFNSMSRYFLGRKWNIIEYPEHLSYYTALTLKNAFQKNNFKLLKFSITGLSPTRLLNSLNNKKDVWLKQIGSEEMVRHKFERKRFMKLLKHIINFMLTYTHTGDTLKFFFKKPN